MLGNWFKTGLLMDATAAAELYTLVRELAERAGLPMPKVCLIYEAQPNAFATGRNPEPAAIAATTGILQLLDGRELRAELAHELSHVRHRDILTSTITASMAGAISTLANFGMFLGGRDDDGGGLAALFRTHPPTAERIHRLLAMKA